MTTTTTTTTIKTAARARRLAAYIRSHGHPARAHGTYIRAAVRLGPTWLVECVPADINSVHEWLGY